MKLIAQVKLITTKEQHQTLMDTIERVNEAANYISQKAWEYQTFGQYNLHHLLYYDVKEHFGLTAQVVVRVLTKVADTYKIDHKIQHIFNTHGSICYDKRILSWQKSSVSIWTISGRLKHIPFVTGKYHHNLLQYRSGETDLIYRNGQFYLLQTCDVQEPPESNISSFLGIDLGIINIAADSDGKIYSGGQVNGLRKRHAKLRTKLQKKNTKASKRLLKKSAGKEKRFARHINHVISKSIVAKAKGTSRGIAIEDLKGIRSKITVRKSQRRQHHSWAFAELWQFIEYKAKMTGVVVKLVNPRYTSQTCPQCGFVSHSNRPSQSLFSCVSCGLSSPADTIAAGNISRRATVNWPNFSPNLAEVGQGKVVYVS